MLCSLWLTLSLSVAISERLRFLINFSKILSSVFWRLALVTLDLVAKISCFAQICPFLNFFSFPSNFCNYSLSSSFHPFPKHCALNQKLHYWSSLQPHSPRKRYGFLFSHSILHVCEWISSFCEILLSLCVIIRTWVCLRCWIWLFGVGCSCY